MTPKTKALAVILSLSILFVGCGQQASTPEVKEVKDTASKVDTVAKPTVAAADTAVAVKYDFLDKVNGTYTLNKKDKAKYPDWNFPNTVKIEVKDGKRIKVGKEEAMKFEKRYEKGDTVLSFGRVSEDSGDFLGGGEIRVNGDKIRYKEVTGSEGEIQVTYVKN
jgi:major membrane immunogen (membrane-anchored lipoprotein)